MKELSGRRLDPRVKLVWRISDTALVVFLAAVIGGPFLILALIPETSEVGSILSAIVGVIALVALVFTLFILPPLRWARWRYDVSEEYLRISKGIIWQKRYIIPFIRVQNTDSRQGPLLRAFHLASVTVSTAAKEHTIPGLDAAEADQLRDRAAELARLAREDV